MATTVFRNRRTDRELETPATGYSSAIQTLFGWKIILQAHPGCLLEPAVPKTGVPQGYHCQLTLRRASPSAQEEQEMLTHRKGTRANFCPADLRVSETQDAGGNRCGWDRATHQELELLGCLVTEREERETKQKIHTLHQFRRWIGFLKHVSLSDKQNTHTPHLAFPVCRQNTQPRAQEAYRQVTFAPQRCTQNHQKRFNPKKHLH